MISLDREEIYPTFLDTETVSLVQGEGVLWEVGAITPADAHGAEVYHRWQLRPDLTQADPESLRISGFASRFALLGGWDAGYVTGPTAQEANDRSLDRLTRPEAASSLWSVLKGRTIAGACVNFDTERIGLWLHRWRSPWLGVPVGQEWRARVPDPWHYHLVDVENLVAGKFRVKPPWKSEHLSKLVEVDPDQFDRHTALGDCCWAREMYDAVYAT